MASHEFPPNISNGVFDVYIPHYLRKASPPFFEGFRPRSFDLELVEPLKELTSVCTKRLDVYGEEIDSDLREVFIIQRETRRIYWLLESRFEKYIQIFGIELSDDFSKAERPLVHFAVPINPEEIDVITCSHLSSLAPFIVEPITSDIKGGRITTFRSYEGYEGQLAEAGILPPIIRHYRDKLTRP